VGGAELPPPEPSPEPGQLSSAVPSADTSLMRIAVKLHTQFLGLEAMVKTAALSMRGVSDSRLLMQLQVWKSGVVEGRGGGWKGVEPQHCC
jgi:hypothetical protein